jgi:hypothetical protein
VRISIIKARKRIATVWFTGVSILFVVVLIQTILGHYGDKVREAWEWLLPNTMPTLSLIIGVLVADTLSSKKIGRKTVDVFIFRLAFFLSLAYLIIVGLTIFLSPFSDVASLELMKLSNLWLAPFQGLVSAVTGAFFVAKTEDT